jgi:hypothetical protein
MIRHLERIANAVLSLALAGSFAWLVLAWWTK